MSRYLTLTDYALITNSSPIKRDSHGWRAKCLQRLVRLDMPVPMTIALSFGVVREIATGAQMNLRHLLGHFPDGQLLSVRPSAEHPEWGGPAAILNIGMNDAMHAEIAAQHGEEVATALYLRFVQSFAQHVARLDPDMFDADQPSRAALDAALRAYEEEMEDPFPQTVAQQLADVLRSMARAWEGTSARLLRQAKGAPVDAGLGLVVQAMAGGIGGGTAAAGGSGAGLIRFIDATTGAPAVKGRFHPGGAGALEDVQYLARDPRGPSLEERCPDAFAQLLAHGADARTRLREEMEIEFTLEDGKLWILDAVNVPRASRAAVRVVVDLANDGRDPAR